MVCYYPVVQLFLNYYCVLYFFLKKRIDIYETKIYAIILVMILIDSICSTTLQIISIKKVFYNFDIFLVNVINRIDFISLIFYSTCLFLYTLIITKDNLKEKIKNIKYDIDKMIVYKDDKELDLTSLELKLVNLLFLDIGKVVRRNTILENIWEWTGNDVDDHTVTVYFNRIREKLGKDIIITVKGLGYRIDEE